MRVACIGFDGGVIPRRSYWHQAILLRMIITGGLLPLVSTLRDETT